MLVDSTKTHNELLNTLLDLSRLRLGNIQYNPERLDIRKLTNEVLEQTKLQAQQKRITQVNQVEECFVKVDRNMIAAVIRNLVVNGIKFTHTGGKIIVGAERAGTEVIVSVKDTGIGIVEEKRDHIFGVNSNKSTTGTANETGTGLGLLLCKEYVERNGGHIWLESEVGKGTTFFFTLQIF
jgi:signal transduction histidine kinase